jgi:sugar phosphate isomerase/epimerase
MDKVTRRQALSCGIRAAAGLTVVRPAAAIPAKRVSKMRFGFTTLPWGSSWDLETLIAKCTQAKALGVEVRTSLNYAHGIETQTPVWRRREVKKRFADSPVALVGVASSERFDWLEEARLKAAMESAEAHVRLSHDTGGHGVRVFPNDFHREVPQQKTIEQISRSLNAVGKYAADFGQMIRLENHGTAGDLDNLLGIMKGVNRTNVRIKLNGHKADAQDFARRFEGVKRLLGDTLHMHELNRGNFPYQLQTDLLIGAGWEGWCLVEATSLVPDPLKALIEEREIWEQLVATSLSRS